MNSLPNELLLSIFGQLKIKDLIQCRMVCKRFMALCDEVKVTELIISTVIEDMKDYWFCSNEQFNHKDAINIRTFATYKTTFKFDKYLKRLYFRGNDIDFYMMDLNDLIRLEELKIRPCVRKNWNSEILNIELPNMKILEIDDIDFLTCRFNLIMPKLESIKCCDIKNIHLHNPKTVKHLEVEIYSDTIKIFKNVQLLKGTLQHFPNLDYLSTFPNLKTLVISKLDGCDSDDEECLRYLVEQKRKRPGFKVYFQSVDMVDVGKIEEYELADSILSFQIQNYDSLYSNGRYYDRLDYNHLMKLVGDTLPDDFHQKYFYVTSVCVNESVKSQRHFLQFLQNLQYLKTVQLKNAIFDQEFYDDFSQISSLTELMIHEERSVVNYNFLLNFKLLETFRTDRDLRDLPILALLKSLKYLTFTNFYFDKEFIAITRNQNIYSFRRYKDPTEGSFRRVKLFEKNRICLDDLVSLIHEYEQSTKN